MISCDVLERPGRWRSVVMGAVLLMAFLLTLPLLGMIAGGRSGDADILLGSGFGGALLRSLLVASEVTAASVLLGLPAGLMAGLYRFRGRRIFLGLLALPLLVPSFLWAIGLSGLRISLGLPSDSFLSGATGSVLAFTCLVLPLVVYMTFFSTRALSKSQVDAARLAGGEITLLRLAARTVFPVALLIGGFGGILTLSDPGPGQILGFSGVASEILISFSALYDFSLAARQCMALTGVVLVITLPMAIFLAPKIASGLLGRDVEPAPLAKNRIVSRLGPSLFAVIFFLTVFMPLFGILRPLINHFPASRALQEVLRTFGNTLLYALLAGTLALIFGYILSIAAGRQSSLRRISLLALFLILSLPPSLGALGVIHFATLAPGWMDSLFRSRGTVGAVLALRFLPVAAVLGMRGFGTTSPSWAFAGAIHGLSLKHYFRRILGPHLLPSALLVLILISLLSSAEVGTVFLLRPPGEDSLPVEIFTVMANAPESLVAALCFFYILGALALMAAGWSLLKRSPL